MIYLYQSIPSHAIEKLHGYLDHFYTQLFAEVSTAYEHRFYIAAEFQNIIDEYPEQIDKKLQRICEEYFKLNKKEKKLFQKAYNNNNDIEGICLGKVTPYKFNELPAKIIPAVESFYENLWDTILTKYKKVIAKCGTVKEHFNEFRKTNTYSVCPFCGLDGLLCEHDDGRDDYDHYIPKAKYPFSCVNFKNLIPVCHNCNSKSKGQKDTPFTEDKPPKQRRLYFPYGYSTSQHEIRLTITSSNTDLRDPSTWSLNISCTPTNDLEKKTSWMEIYNIETRYKAIIAKRHKNVWFERLQKRYIQKSKNKTTAVDFRDFRNEFTFDYSEIKDMECGILLKNYYDFLFQDKNLENNLRGII